MGISYKDAGVDIDKGNEAVRLMKDHVKSTFNEGVLTDIGGFGGLFQLNTNNCPEPVLVSGTDGVGTKLKIAMLMDKHDTIGIDAVAMCVNDILVQGAAPLFVLDYLACGKLEPQKIADIVSGVAEGCRQSNAALIGGETAEMPDFYAVDELGCTVGEELLTPTKIYVKDILPLLQKYDIKAMSHITGGGLIENIPRCINPWLNAVIDVAWPVPPIFSYLQKIGKVSPLEMHRVFNMGLGFIVIADPETASKIEDEDPRFMRVGYLEPGEGKTEIMGVNI